MKRGPFFHGRSTPVGFPGVHQLLAPREVGLIAGEPVSVYFAGLAFLPSTSGFTFTFTGPGTSDSEHWAWASPTVGNYTLTIYMYSGVTLVGRVSTTLRVRPASGSSGVVRLNVNGNSITAAGIADSFPAVTKTLLQGVGLTVTTHGSHNHSGNANEEGNPGYTYGDFNGERPLVNPTPYPAGGPAYVTTWGGGSPFTDVPIMLGTNDGTFGGDPSLWPGFAQDVCDSADSFIQTVKSGSPNARIWISMIYNVSNTAADWGTPGDTELAAHLSRRIVLVPAIYGRFMGREAENIRLLWTNGALNPIGDFSSNTVHPNSLGHGRIARILAGAIRSRYT